MTINRETLTQTSLSLINLYCPRLLHASEHKESYHHEDISRPSPRQLFSSPEYRLVNRQRMILRIIWYLGTYMNIQYCRIAAMNHETHDQYGQISCICIHRCFSARPIARMHLIFRYFHAWEQIWQSENHLKSHDDSQAQWLHESRRNEVYQYTGTRREGQPDPSTAQQGQRSRPGYLEVENTRYDTSVAP